MVNEYKSSTFSFFTLSRKLLIIFTMLMWLIYDVVIKSYTSAIFDFMNIIANMLTLLQIKLVKKVKNYR